MINKLAVHYLPAPSFVLLAQVTCSWIAVKFVGMLGLIDVDEIEVGKMRDFFPVAFAFLACIFANIKTLQYANVETFIVFRASTPLLIGIAEWAFMGRELPNTRSTVALLALVGGAVWYVVTDASFVVHGYTPGRFLLTKSAEFPFFGNDAVATSIAYQRMFEKYMADAGEHDGGLLYAGLDPESDQVLWAARYARRGGECADPPLADLPVLL